MAYRLYWLLEERVLIGEWWDSIDGAELRAYNDQALQMAATSAQTVHLISLSGRVNHTQLGLKDLQTIAQDYQRTTKIMWRLFVSPNRLDRIVANLAGQFFMGHYRQFATLEEALKFLREVDDSLPDLIPLMPAKA
jgi:hypothetical protein